MAAIFVVAVSAQALDPAMSAGQYNCRTWTRQTGLPSTGVVGIAQTEDKYLWLGTRQGLIRFDGVSFTTFDLASTQGGANGAIRGMAPARGGGLWVGFDDNGFGFFDGNAVSPRGGTEWQGQHVWVHSLSQDNAGTVWVASVGGGWRLLPSGKFERIRLPGVDEYDAYMIANGAEGRAWMCTVSDGIAEIQGDAVRRLALPELMGVNNVAIAEDRAGNVWVGTTTGLHGYDRELHHQQSLLAGEEVRALLVDRAGAVWIGSGSGLYRWWNDTLVAVRPEGLVPGSVLALCEDSDSGLWIGTANGLSHLTQIKFPTEPAAVDLSLEEVYGVASSPRGGIWTAHGRGLSYRDGKSFTTLGHDAGLADVGYKRIYEAKDGTVYAVEGLRTLVTIVGGHVVSRYQAANLVVGIVEDAEGVVISVGGSLLRFRAGNATPYRLDDSPPMNWIHNLLVAHDGALWVASSNGIFRINDGHVTHWGKHEGLPDLAVLTLAEDSDNVIWAGLLTGIVRVKGDRASRISRAEGLYNDDIYGIAPDDLGNLWVSSGRGMFCVSRQAMNDVADGRAAKVTCVVYDGPESVRPTEKFYEERVAARSADGRLWFPTAKGVVVIDPHHVPRNETAPTVHIEHVAANRADLPRSPMLRVPPGRGELAFRFTAIDFNAPERIRFRYQLVGYDPQWVDAGTARMAAYNNLRPGQYRFRVAAANSDGVWNRDGDSVAIELLPHYYQTHWFYLLCGLAGVGALGVAHKTRVRRLHRRAAVLAEHKAQLEREVARRTAELATTNENLRREEQELQRRTVALEQEIEERKRIEREVARVHRELLEVSRRAGMADVATNVLHNVGNVLNSVNVSTTVLADGLRKSKVEALTKIAALLKENATDLARFLQEDPKGLQVIPYLEMLAGHLSAERNRLVAETDALRRNVEHIKQVVARQETFAHFSGVVENVAPAELFEDALQMTGVGLMPDDVAVIREFAPCPPVAADRHKTLQILTNLLQNAKSALDRRERGRRELRLGLEPAVGVVRFIVADNGEGIAPENLTRIFDFGFDSRENGGGSGLHACANAAREMQGSLRARSAGVGQGAAFTLELPLATDERSTAGK